jgi:hypothetical protein
MLEQGGEGEERGRGGGVFCVCVHVGGCKCGWLSLSSYANTKASLREDLVIFFALPCSYLPTQTHVPSLPPSLPPPVTGRCAVPARVGA